MNATQIARAVASREISPLEVAEEALRAAEAWQPVTNAFSQLRPEETMAEARALADSPARMAGPLAGVPVAVKDLFDVEGWETTGCCALFRGRVAREDAEAVRRLRVAGAVVIGKTNQHELAAGATNVISDCGPTRNPWDPERITGGSSGGSAAAVATVVPLGLGTDTGGSIRIPASFCGISGLKPTLGSVTMTGAMPLSPSMDTAGPLATTAADLAAAFSALSEREIVPAPPAGRRLAVLGGPVARTARQDVLDATDRVARVLGEAGATVSAVELTGADDALGVWERVAWAEFAQGYSDLVDSPHVHERTRDILAFGRRVLSELPSARQRMEGVRAAFLEVLRDADALLLPATPFPAPRRGDRIVDAGSIGLDVRTGAPSVLTRPVSLSGLPAVSLPAGVSDEGLPMGAQLVGRDGEEALLLGLMQAFQEASDVHLRRPVRPD